MRASYPGFGSSTQTVTTTTGTQTVNFQLQQSVSGEYYVSPTGDDGNDGTTSYSAWATIENGDKAGVVQAGATVHVLPGTYTYANELQLTKSGTAGNPITYQAEGPVTISFTNPGNCGFYLWPVNYCVLDGFTTVGSNGVNGTNGSSIMWNNSNNGVVKNCNFSSTAWCWGACAFRTDDSMTFENNVVGPYPWGNSTGMQVSWGGTNTKIYNNTFVGCSESAIDFDATNGPTTGSEVKNNIIDNTGNHGLNVENGATVTHTNNLFFGNGNDFGGTTADPSEIVGKDPLLDSTYHLQAGSPAIDAGCYVGLPFNGLWPDIGAFEYGSGSQPAFCTVTGKVTDGNGAALTGALVTAGVNSSVSATTNGSGIYTLTNVTVGAQPMTASLSGYTPTSGTVTLVAGYEQRR